MDSPLSSKIPTHVAIIMDGNGRWATRQNLPRLMGHHKGVERVDEVVECCLETGVRYLTLYSFSHENWNRPLDEVKGLMDLLQSYLSVKREKMIQSQIRFQTIGEIDLLPEATQLEIRETIRSTAQFDRLTLILALSYGARREIIRGIQRVLKESSPDQVLEMTSDHFSNFLDTSPFPDPDLLIRTGGEYRVSNFLLWQMAYTELYFSDVLWPDFKDEDFFRAIHEYQNRERRFGLTSEQLKK